MMWLFVACAGKDAAVPKDTDEPKPLAPLAEPWLGILTPVSSEFRSDCVITVELLDTVGATLDSSSMVAVGGQWTGLRIESGMQYTARATWETCNTGPNGTGEFTASLFSGTAGDLFVFRYDGTTSAFETLVQREDFEGGGALATFSAVTDVEALGAGLDPVEADGGWTFSWMDTTPVGEVLTTLTADSGFTTGSPVWIEQPEWW